MSVRYRNVDTEDVLTYSQPQRRLERSDSYVRVEDDRPAQSASKDEWAEHAEAVGVDVEGLTKDEIIDAVS